VIKQLKSSGEKGFRVLSTRPKGVGVAADKSIAKRLLLSEHSAPTPGGEKLRIDISF